MLNAASPNVHVTAKFLKWQKAIVAAPAPVTVPLSSASKGLQYAYRDRRNKKRTFRALWIQRINAAARQNGMVYSTFMAGIIKAGITLDRKVLADIAVKDAAMFTALAKQSQDALKKQA